MQLHTANKKTSSNNNVQQEKCMPHHNHTRAEFSKQAHTQTNNMMQSVTYALLLWKRAVLTYRMSACIYKPLLPIYINILVDFHEHLTVSKTITAFTVQHPKFLHWTPDCTKPLCIRYLFLMMISNGQSFERLPPLPRTISAHLAQQPPLVSQRSWKRLASNPCSSSTCSSSPSFFSTLPTCSSFLDKTRSRAISEHQTWDATGWMAVLLESSCPQLPGSTRPTHERCNREWRLPKRVLRSTSKSSWHDHDNCGGELQFTKNLPAQCTIDH